MGYRWTLGIMVALLLALPLLACQGGAHEDDRGRHGDGKRTAMEQDLDGLCTASLTATSGDYLAMEKQLRDAGPAALTALAGMDVGVDPVAPLFRSVLQEWIENNPSDYPSALGYLDSLPQRLSRTPVTQPSPSGVAAFLTKHHEDRVTGLLAWRLLKSTDWPDWRTAGVLLYLEQQRDPRTTAALLRFLGRTENDQWRDFATDAVRAFGDVDLKAKLVAEREYHEKQGAVPPAAIVKLEALVE